MIRRVAPSFVLKRCLDLLAELREQFAKYGFSRADTAILERLYGDANRSNLGDDLSNEYGTWLNAAGASKDKTLAERYKSYVLAAIDKEMRRLKKHQKARAAIESERMKVEAVRRVVPESPVLDRLLRYEASFERAFDRTLSQLERLQRMRLGQAVPPPINVNVSSS